MLDIWKHFQKTETFQNLPSEYFAITMTGISTSSSVQSLHKVDKKDLLKRFKKY